MFFLLNFTMLSAILALSFSIKMLMKFLINLEICFLIFIFFICQTMAMGSILSEILVIYFILFGVIEGILGLMVYLMTCRKFGSDFMSLSSMG